MVVNVEYRVLTTFTYLSIDIGVVVDQTLDHFLQTSLAGHMQRRSKQALDG